MKYRQLGRTGLEVSEVGFGGAGIGHVWGPTTDAECVGAIRRALDLGINFFDTSPVYGAGRSETNLGAALGGERARVIVATKVRLHDEVDLDGMAAAIRHSLEQSLVRLATDYVDVLQIHHQVGAARGRYVANPGPPPRHALLLGRDECLAFADAAGALVGEGKVRHLGITAWDGLGPVVRALMESGRFATAQILYNLVNQTAAAPPPPVFDDVDQGCALAAAAASDIGVIAVRSHAAGALADRLDREVGAGTDVARDHARARLLSGLGWPAHPTLSALALRFCLDNPAIATVVPGFKNAGEVEEAAACVAAPPLGADELARIDALYRRGFAD